MAEIDSRKLAVFEKGLKLVTQAHNDPLQMWMLFEKVFVPEDFDMIDMEGRTLSFFNRFRAKLCAVKSHRHEKVDFLFHRLSIIEKTGVKPVKKENIQDTSINCADFTIQINEGIITLKSIRDEQLIVIYTDGTQLDFGSAKK